MKLLSDFDGVWTDPSREAEFVKLFLVAEAARLAGIAVDEAALDFERFERTVRAAPTEYGWAPDGRITAFVDEDPFCVTNAVASHLARAERDPRARRYRDAIRDRGHADLNAFVDQCFVRACADFREQHPPALVPGAGRAVQRLAELGVELVIVSNSPAEKIVDWFERAGVEAAPDGQPALRVRGSAGKQTLGADGARLECGPRSILVDRPLYRAILEQERPDLVIGDVFSLDLALPFVMRRDGQGGAPAELVLRRHHYTPEWVLELARGPEIDHLVADVAELVELCDR